MKYISQILLILLFTLASSCSKYDCDDCIYFRCKVDGKEWRMNCNTQEPFGCSAYDVQYYRYDGTNNIYLYIKNDDNNSAVKLYAKNIDSTGLRYVIRRPGTTFSSYIDRNTKKLCDSYKMDTLKYNYLRLNEIDTINYIVGGEFEFTGQDSCGNVVQITEGKFRLRYRF